MRFPSTVLAVVLFLLSACAPERRVEPDNLYWPFPPAPPKLKYVQSIYSEDDIGHEYSFIEMLLGKGYFDSIGRPYGVYARHGKIYVTDIMLARVLIFDLASKHLYFAGEEGALQTPAAVAADSEGRMFVADVASAKIAVYDRGGRYVTAFPLPGIKPVSLAFDESRRRLYIADGAAHKIVAINTDGAVLFEFGGKGSADGMMNMPRGITVDRNGKVYVLDAGNFRVQTFDSDGRFLGKFGSVGDRAGYFANPKSIAVNSEGHIYVTDAAFSNFQIFDQEGNILLSVGRLGVAPGQMYLPAGIAIDENDRIYMADQLNRRIQVFQYLKEP